MRIKANNANSESGVIFPELSYEIVGAAFDVFNKSGWGLPEKYYQNALAARLQELGIGFKKEVSIPLSCGSARLGRYFADFIIEENILLELKVVPRLGYAHVKQTLGYLRTADIKLGILLYFTRDGVKYRRVINSKV